MIKSYRNTDLENFWTRGDEIKSVPTELTRWVELALDLLDAAVKPEDTFIPGLPGYIYEEDDKERFGIVVAIGWRLSYEWEDDNAINIDLERVI